MVVNGITVFEDQAPSKSLPPSPSGEYFFCANCMYNTWIIPPSPFGDAYSYLQYGDNNFVVYSSGTDVICIAGWQLFMDIADVGLPTIDTQPLTVNVYSTDQAYVSLNIDEFITGQQDNCDHYFNNDFLLLDSIESPESVSIWDYPYTTVYLNYCDWQENCGTETQTVYITPNPYPITYPTGGGVTFPIQNIIIRWANYAPIVNSKTVVNIWVVPSNCGFDAQTVILGQNIHYYLFELYYSDAVHALVTINSDSDCSYSLYVQFVGTPGSVTFPYYNVLFCDKDLGCS